MVSKAPLYVYAFPPEARDPVRCAVSVQRGDFFDFRYSEDWLNYPGCFPIDPKNLPLHINNMDRLHAQKLPSVFEDAGPGGWGKRIIDRATNPDMGHVKINFTRDYLIHLGESTTGALCFSESMNFLEERDKTAPLMPDIPLSDWANFIQNLEGSNSEAAHDFLKKHGGHLLNGGGSMGGMRPKAVIQHQDGPYIYKFRSNDDKPREGIDSLPALEYMTMRMAGDLGLHDSPLKLEIINGDPVFGMKRFDREEQTDEAGAFFSRKALISLETLCDNKSGHNSQSYSDITDVLTAYSGSPANDRVALFKQALLNVAINNTDDHFRNFSMIHNNNSWHLSPAYDIVPQVGRTADNNRSTLINGKFAPDLMDVLIGRRAFHITDKEARGAVADFVAVAANWRDYAKEADLTRNDLDKFAQKTRKMTEQDLSSIEKTAKTIHQK